jgi:hypothetical protein
VEPGHCPIEHESTTDAHFSAKSVNLMSNKKEDVMAKGNNARKKETKKPKKDKK